MKMPDFSILNTGLPGTAAGQKNKAVAGAIILILFLALVIAYPYLTGGAGEETGTWLSEAVPLAGEGQISGVSGYDAGGLWRTAIWPALATILVLGLAYACLLVYRALSRGGLTVRKTHEQLQLHQSLRLTNNGSLHVVRFGDEVLLLGATPSGLTLLSRSSMAADASRSHGFEDLLDGALTRAHPIEEQN